jgi:PhnB protein
LIFVDKSRACGDDGCSEHNEQRVNGNAVCLYVSGGTPSETKRLFQALSQGGVVTDPIADQPFGLYGALNDKFGVRWMFHAAA